MIGQDQLPAEESIMEVLFRKMMNLKQATFADNVAFVRARHLFREQVKKVSVTKWLAFVCA